MKTIRDQQTEALNVFITSVQSARGGNVSEQEMELLIEWFDDLMQSLSAANLVRNGSAVPYWDEDLDEPVFSLTQKGLDAAPQDLKDKARDKNVFN